MADYEIELRQFISDSFEAWGWDSEEEHQILISTWAERLNDPDNAEKEEEWIRILIKALKDERASFKKQLTIEFMLTRRLLVKGLKYGININTFKARMVFYDADPKIKTKALNRKRKCRWMKPGSKTNFPKRMFSIFSICALRIQAPRDIELWIGKHKIV